MCLSLRLPGKALFPFAFYLHLSRSPLYTLQPTATSLAVHVLALVSVVFAVFAIVVSAAASVVRACIWYFRLQHVVQFVHIGAATPRPPLSI